MEYDSLTPWSEQKFTTVGIEMVDGYLLLLLGL